MHNQINDSIALSAPNTHTHTRSFLHTHKKSEFNEMYSVSVGKIISTISNNYHQIRFTHSQTTTKSNGKIIPDTKRFGTNLNTNAGTRIFKHLCVRHTIAPQTNQCLFINHQSQAGYYNGNEELVRFSSNQKKNKGNRPVIIANALRLIKCWTGEENDAPPALPLLIARSRSHSK